MRNSAKINHSTSVEIHSYHWKFSPIVTNYLYFERVNPLKIGADLLANTPIVTPSSNNKQLQRTGAGTLESGKLFVNVLTEYMKQQEQPNTTISTPTSSYIPDFYSVIAPDFQEMYMPLNRTNSLSYQPVDATKLNQSLGGKLAGMAEVFDRAGQLYNVHPALLAAISQHETGNGNSLAAREKNNVAGMMGPNGLRSYATVEESIMAMARNLGNNYLGKGLTTIGEIGAKYAPIGASNDPTGLNNHWVSGVTKYFNRLSQ